MPLFPEPPPPPETGGQDRFCDQCGSPLDTVDTVEGICPKCPSTQEVPVSPPSPHREAETPEGSQQGKRLLGIAVVIVFIAILAVGIGVLLTSEEEDQVVENPPVGDNPVAVSRSPLPIETVPKGTEVYFQVVKDPTTRVISVTFSGGPGQNVLKELVITVTRSDGQVLNATLPPEIRSETTLPGSRGDDRVEVAAVYTSGHIYRLFDEVLKERVSIYYQ